jgi:hypothetical protein
VRGNTIHLWTDKLEGREQTSCCADVYGWTHPGGCIRLGPALPLPSGTCRFGPVIARTASSTAAYKLPPQHPVMLTVDSEKAALDDDTSAGANGLVAWPASASRFLMCGVV